MSQVADLHIIQPKGHAAMETWIDIYRSLACMAASCLAIPAGPVAVWALIQHYRK